MVGVEDGCSGGLGREWFGSAGWRGRLCVGFGVVGFGVVGFGVVGFGVVGFGVVWCGRCLWEGMGGIFGGGVG